MARTRAEVGLRKSREERKSRPPNGESASTRAKTPRPKPPAALAPNPLEEPAEEGAAGPVGRGAAPPFGDPGEPAPEALPRRVSTRGDPPAVMIRASVWVWAAAMRAPRAPSASSPVTTAGGPCTSQALDDATLLGATARAPGSSHLKDLKEPLAAAAGSEGDKPIVVVARLLAPRGVPNLATGAGEDPVPATGIAPGTGADTGSSGTIGPPPTGSGLGDPTCGDPTCGDPTWGGTFPSVTPVSGALAPGVGVTVSSTAPIVGPSASPIGSTTGLSVSPTGATTGSSGSPAPSTTG